LKSDLKIGDSDSSKHSDKDSSDEIDSKQGKREDYLEQQQEMLSLFEINVKVFIQTANQFRDTEILIADESEVELV
jgi:hypothetical protein